MSGAGQAGLRAGRKKRAEEIRMLELWEIFQRADSDGDGALNRDEWATAMRLSGFGSLDGSELDEHFRAADRDRDGKISFEEFSGRKTMTERAFQIMDRDGDGTISKEEFIKACPSLTVEQVELSFAKFAMDEAKTSIDYQGFCKMMNARRKTASASTRRRPSLV